MTRCLCILLAAALLFTYGFVRVFSAPPPFSIIPPIADVNPSICHPLAVKVPTVLRCEQHGDHLVVSYSRLENTNLMVGRNMVVGLMSDAIIDQNGVRQPFGGLIQSSISLDAETNTLTLGRYGMPPAGHKFTYEIEFIIFETDVPAQHMWDPQSGKYYKALWSASVRTAVR